MLSLTYIFDSTLYLYVYMVIYNTTLITLFWVVFSTISTKLKTLHQLNNNSFNTYNLIILTVLIFSMAGVPPFIGFFTKLFIIILFINGSFSLLFVLLLILLLVGLYFYVQNIKFLHSTNMDNFNYIYVGNERVVIIYYYYSIFILLLLILGVFFIDDLLLLVSWFFN